MQKAERLALSMNDEGFWLAFSGGKDSQVLYHLAVMAGFRSVNVKYPEDLCGINQQWINECSKVVIGNVTDTPELMK